jgi:hypothetical protein
MFVAFFMRGHQKADLVTTVVTRSAFSFSCQRRLKAVKILFVSLYGK